MSSQRVKSKIITKRSLTLVEINQLMEFIDWHINYIRDDVKVGDERMIGQTEAFSAVKERIYDLLKNPYLGVK